MKTVHLSKFVLALAALFCAALSVRAEPELKPLGDAPLPNAFHTGSKYTLRLSYQDKKGDDIEKATFHDESGAGNIEVEKKSVDGSPDSGATITWEINGFEKGSHKGYFTVKTQAGETRYPAARDEFYQFKVESILDKVILTVLGVVVCLVAIPFLVYLIARSANPRGNPSSVARIGLFIGIFGALAIFIWQFMGIVDNPLYWVLAGVVAVALLVAVVIRR